MGTTPKDIILMAWWQACHRLKDNEFSHDKSLTGEQITPSTISTFNNYASNGPGSWLGVRKGVDICRSVEKREWYIPFKKDHIS